MKVLITGTGRFSDNYGGGQVYVKNLVFELMARKHDVTYLSLVSGSNSALEQLWFDQEGFKECQLTLPRALFDSELISETSVGKNDLASIFTDIQPDVIHANGWKQMVCIAANKVGIPCVITAHHGGIVCPGGTLLNNRDEICRVSADHNTCLPCLVRSIPGGKLWLPLLRVFSLDSQLRFGRWLRARHFLYFVTPLGGIALSIHEKLASIKKLGKYATRLLAPSSAIQTALVRNGIPESRIRMIPHGIPLPDQQPLRTDLGAGPLRFLFIGRISRVKGVHVMLEAFNNIQPEKYELHIVGGAVTKAEQRYLAKLRRRYASVNAVWHGARPHDEVPQHIAACDVMVHPAIFMEVFGLTIAEALAVGRPVIASRCGGADAQIRDGENGILVAPNDVPALRHAILSVIDAPSNLQMMASHAGAVVSMEQHVRELEQVYTDIS